jgi:anti-sigma regulatory factor (Ser/Thr protein kinase)
MSYISYRQKKYKQLQFTFSTKVSFEKILATLNEVSFNGSTRNDEQAVYAILELISNSLRAHREKKIREKIVLKIHTDGERVLVKLKDKGGGFDPSHLPYDINLPVEEIDPVSESFDSYRQKHDYKRFGMGLLLARKIFPGFKLSFVDENGMVQGTIVDLCNKEFDTGDVLP